MSDDLEDNIRKKYEEMISNLHKKRKEVSTNKNLNAEQIYSGVENSLKQSAGHGRGFEPNSIKGLSESAPKDYNKDTGGSSFYREREVSTWGKDKDWETIKQTHVDGERIIETRYNPENNKMKLIAKKVAKEQKSKYTWFAGDAKKKDIPDVIKYNDIASIELNPDSGHVGMINSTYSGSKERAVDRLMMEVQKMDIHPNSSALTQEGRKMMARKAKDFIDTPKSEYLEKIQRFLDKGKLNKLWKAAPVIGPAIGAATALYSDDSQAALDEGIGMLDPTGLVSPERMGNSELPPEIEEKKRKYNREYLEKLKRSK